MGLIEVGQRAPAFSLRDQHGNTHTLRGYAGRPLVLYFYPEDLTPLCTTQACQARDHRADFGKIKAAIVGVSPDDEATHKRFDDTHALGFTLLADTGRNRAGHPAMCAAYGVYREKMMYGRRVMGLARTTYLIDGDGIVRHRWDSVRTPGHWARVLAVTKELLGMTPKAKGKVRKGVSDSAPPAKAVRGGKVVGKRSSESVRRNGSLGSAMRRKPIAVRGRR